MIGLSQWRAVIGLWNSCRTICLVNHSPLSNPFRQPFDIEGGNCSLNRVPSDPSITCFSSVISKEDNVKVQEDDSLSKRSFVTVSGDTICRVVTLMFYLLFLLLLSGDVELNPGPITVEQGNSSGSNNNNYYYCTVRTQINESLQKHFVDLERTTKDCISDIRAKLFSERLISEAVNYSPTFGEVFNDFMTGLQKLSDISMLVEHYKNFLDCLKCSGGPSSQDVIDSLKSEWKTNESQSKP